MDLKTVIETNRNVREFARASIPAAALERILESARIASSAFNFQPWRFVVVQDPATITRLVEFSKGQDFVGDASAVVVCCGQRYNNPWSWLGEKLYLLDLGIAIDHLQLAARNEGIGSCWIAVFDHEPIKALLSVPEGHDVVMLVPLGFPVTEAAFRPTSDRLGLHQIAFCEKFGSPWAKAPAVNPPMHAATPSFGAAWATGDGGDSSRKTKYVPAPMPQTADLASGG